MSDGLCCRLRCPQILWVRTISLNVTRVICHRADQIVFSVLIEPIRLLFVVGVFPEFVVVAQHSQERVKQFVGF
jgi:hypothetical protein